MAVNYTNSGTYTSYEDGTPVNLRMDLTFKEINPIYFEDYLPGNGGDGGAGFNGYFSEPLNIVYQSPLSHKNSSGDYIVIKNLFRRTKLADYKNAASVFDKFVIGDVIVLTRLQRHYMEMQD